MHRCNVIVAGIAVVAPLAVFGMPGVATAKAAVTTRASVGNNNVQANGDSGTSGAAISPDGRYVAFTSRATNLAGKTAGRVQVYLRDRVSGTTVRVSQNASGAPGDGDSTQPAVSENGRYVAFTSEAGNLVPGLTGHPSRIFRRDMRTGKIADVSVQRNGRDSSGSFQPTMSADGRFVCFVSYGGSLLVKGDDNFGSDVFVRDMQTATTQIASLTTAGKFGQGLAYNARISRTGRYVVLSTEAALGPGNTDFIDVWVRDLQRHATSRITGSPSEYTSDSYGANGVAVSDDGRYVVYDSDSRTVVPSDNGGVINVYVTDRSAKTTRRVSQALGGAAPTQWSGVLGLAMSGDGRRVTYSSLSNNLVPDDVNQSIDIFVTDLARSATSRISVNASGKAADGDSYYPDISRDGTVVTFVSAADNLVAGDTNRRADVFVSAQPVGN